ncbi:hypothetical protein E0E54_12555 [Azotobacter chroococcum]|uniref:Uncharacterized protein n=1 Tax=Azotobacter chroococcum NCIMB 8003 TaxID=1328314 RepID=A0A0C4WNN7_9GAMM|nr:Hypothetical protein Achr_27710 [Azotobacter chroococcum NCIMB 8003]TBW02140.1 hypothetical protein E0E52_18040 [Azotobacter chroococcum]TBW35139.1 hypothetical protein E0E54_12555 [Azotobacter chroococcum]TKD44362.1 hypothetical protein FCG41_06600 [Azotobacter chroococcum]
MFPGEGRPLYIRALGADQCKDGGELPRRRLPEPRKARPLSVDRAVPCGQDTARFMLAAGG